MAENDTPSATPSTMPPAIVRFRAGLRLVDNPALHATAARGGQVHVRSRLTRTRDYPAPVVDHDFARQRALAAFATLRAG